MPLCPNHHLSEAADFCAICGVEMSAPAPAALAATSGEPCPVCGTPREAPGSVFCEVCGYNFAGRVAPADAERIAPSPPAPVVREPDPPVGAKVRWELEARVLTAEDPGAPRDAAARLFPLDLADHLIGRRSPRRGILPDIALDPDDGISHRHACLRRRDDGGFDLLDLGSANGTLHNGKAAAANVAIPLQDGDRIRLGRWTELLLRIRHL